MLLETVIWGSSGHARVVADILRLDGRYKIAGLVEDFDHALHGSEIFGMKVLGGRDCIGSLGKYGVTHLVFGFGDCQARLALASVVEAAGLEFASAIHPSATVAEDSKLAGGTIVAAGAIINPGAVIGRNCIINSAAVVEHECIIGDAVHIGPRAVLGGRVTVDHGAWVAIGATVRDRVTIGAGSLVGAGVCDYKVSSSWRCGLRQSSAGS